MGVKKLSTLLLVTLTGVVFAQTTNFTTSDYWKRQKHELIMGVGATNTLTDLGGLNRIGTDYSFVDLEWSATRFGVHFGYRYRFKPLWCTKTILQYGMFSGSDALTNEPARHNRNLSFTTHLVELSQHLELIIFNNEHYGARHRIKGLRGMKNKNTLVYVFSGITGFIYMPQAQGGPFLRPLHTEGQGLPNGPKKYGLFNYGIPFGMGVKIGLNQVWRMSFELSYTKTFTDYFDDVSTVYYDNSALQAAYGSTSAQWADPSNGAFPSWTHPGEQRGDPKQNDAYFFFNVSFIRNMTEKGNRRIKWKYKARY